jgi:hypothetical protein
MNNFFLIGSNSDNLNYLSKIKIYNFHLNQLFLKPQINLLKNIEIEYYVKAKN